MFSITMDWVTSQSQPYTGGEKKASGGLQSSQWRECTFPSQAPCSGELKVIFPLPTRPGLPRTVWKVDTRTHVLGAGQPCCILPAPLLVLQNAPRPPATGQWALPAEQGFHLTRSGSYCRLLRESVAHSICTVTACLFIWD